MEKQYDPYSNSYQFDEFFGAEEPSRKGHKVIKKAESYLRTESRTKHKHASKAKESIGKYSPQLAAALTLGFSNIFNRHFHTRDATKAVSTAKFDCSQIQATWPKKH